MAPRGKIVVARIDNETKRKACLRKRRPGLLKKVSELTTLCDAEAAVVIYSHDDNQTTVWPSTPQARATIAKFQSRPELERMKSSHNSKSFLEEKCKKKMNKALRLIEMNEKRYVQALATSILNGKTRIQDIDSEQEKKVNAVIDKKKEDLLLHIQKLKEKEQQASSAPQVVFPATKTQRVSQARSGLNINGLIAGRNFKSPAASREQLMNFRGMTPLTPLSLSPPTHNPLVMLPCDLAANRHEMTRRLYGGTLLGGMMEQAPSQPQALPQALQMPPSIQVESALSMNGLARGKSFSSPTSAAYDRLRNLRGMARGALSPIHVSLPTPNLLLMLPNNSAAKSLSMTQSLRGPTNFGVKHPLTSKFNMPPPALSAEPTVFSADIVPNMNDYSLIRSCTRVNTGEENVGMMQQHAPLTSLPLGYSLINPLSNRLHRTGGLFEQMNFSGMMQHSLNTTDNGLTNASLRTFTEDGNFIGGMLQHEPPPHMTLELPRRLGLPPTPPTQYEESGSNMFEDEYGWNTVRFSTPETPGLDQSNFGNDYRWNINEFAAPATTALDQSYSDNGMSNAGWVDDETVFEIIRNAPPTHGGGYAGVVQPASEVLNIEMNATWF